MFRELIQNIKIMQSLYGCHWQNAHWNDFSWFYCSLLELYWYIYSHYNVFEYLVNTGYFKSPEEKVSAINIYRRIGDIYILQINIPHNGDFIRQEKIIKSKSKNAAIINVIKVWNYRNF